MRRSRKEQEGIKLTSTGELSSEPVINYSHNVDIYSLRRKLLFETPELQKEFDKMYAEVGKLEGIVRYKDKEIERLSYLNQYLTESQQKRDEIILENQKEIQRLKQLLILYQKKVDDMPRGTVVKDGVIGRITLPTEEDSYLIPQTHRKAATYIPKKSNRRIVDAKNRNTADPKIPQNKVHKPIDHTVTDPVQVMLENVNQEDRNSKNFFTLDENSALSSLKENESVKFLGKVVRDETDFAEFLTNLNYRGRYLLMTHVRLLLRDFDVNISALLKLKRMLNGVSKIAGASDTITAIEHVAKTVCEILGCDRCSAFVYDLQNNELWTPTGSSNRVYRISDQSGIAGYVARTAKIENIKDVYNDNRFDNTYDVRTGYRTKTMLAVPVKGKDGEVLGVLQAINKLSPDKSSDIFFNMEDNGILEALAQILTNILHNSLLHDDRELFYQDLLKVLEVGSVLNSKRIMKEFLLAARELMLKLFNVSQLRVYLYNEEQQMVKFLVDDTGKFDVQPAMSGLISVTISQRTAVRVPSGEAHPEFNALVDIPTVLPLYVRPILSPDKGHIVGFLEMTSLRGLDGLHSRNETNEKPVKNGMSIRDDSVLDNFVNQLGRGIMDINERELATRGKSLFDFGLEDSDLRNLNQRLEIEHTTFIKNAPGNQRSKRDSPSVRSHVTSEADSEEQG